MSVTVRAVAPETAAPAESCTVIIFGATGDRNRRKLISALFALRCFGALSSGCEVIGAKGEGPWNGSLQTGSGSSSSSPLPRCTCSVMANTVVMGGMVEGGVNEAALKERRTRRKVGS